MQNSYLVDVFLSACMAIMVLYVVIDAKTRLKQMSAAINPSMFGAAFNQIGIKATLFSVPIIAVLMFLLWRFYALLYISQSLGAGGIGLIIIIGLAGSALIWLNMVLMSVKQMYSQDFVRAERLQAASREPVKQAPIGQSRLG